MEGPTKRLGVSSESPVTVGLKWDEIQGQDIDLDLQCVILNDIGQIEDAVYYNELTSKISKLKLSEDSHGEKEGFDELLTIDLNSCPFQVKYLAILICSYKGQPLSNVESSQLQVMQNSSIILEFSLGSNRGNSLSCLPCIFERSYDGKWTLMQIDEIGTGQTFLENEGLIKKGLIKCGFDQILFEECKNWKGDKTFKLEKNHSLIIPSSLKCISIGLGWDTRCDIDSSLLVYNADNIQIDNIYFGNKQNQNKSIVHRGDNTTGNGAGDDEVIDIYLDNLAPNVQVIWAVITIYSSSFQFDDVEGAYCRLFSNDTKKEFCKFSLSKNKDGVSTGNIMCSITRCKEGSWSISPKGFYIKGVNTSGGVNPIIQRIYKNDFSEVKTLDQIKPPPPPIIPKPVAKHQRVFLIKIVKATGLGSFDSNGFSDPYVSVRVNGKSLKKTPIIKKNLNPIWNYDFQMPLSEGDRIEFKLFDHDSIVSDDYMGSGFVNIDSAFINKANSSLELQVLDKNQIVSQKFTGTLFVNFIQQ